MEECLGCMTIDVPPQFLCNLPFLCFLCEVNYHPFHCLFYMFCVILGQFVCSLILCGRCSDMLHNVLINGWTSVWGVWELTYLHMFCVICHFVASFMMKRIYQTSHCHLHTNGPIRRQLFVHAPHDRWLLFPSAWWPHHLIFSNRVLHQRSLAIVRFIVFSMIWQSNQNDLSGIMRVNICLIYIF